MKTKLSIIVAVIIFTGNGLYAVPDKIFTSSGYIFPGEEYGIVRIYNDDTVVNMLGGMADYIATYDKSTLNVSYGQMEAEAFNYSIVNIYGGTHWGATASDHGIVDFSGDAVSRGLGADVFGIANMYGGTVEYVGVGDSGMVNLYGGIITECLGAYDLAIVNIYGYGFNYDPTAGSRDGGQLTGFWFDDTPFTIDLSGEQTYSHVNLIPEPSSLILLTLGALMLRAC